jgi:hypothetical protein
MRFVVSTILILVLSLGALAQEIDFGDYSTLYSVTLSELSPGMDLEFGTVMESEGIVSIDINDAKIFSIEGVRYLDIIVDLTADQYLLLDGNLSYSSDPTRRIELTMAAAYANLGMQSTAQAKLFNVVGTTASAQFPIKYRGNAPPGPPPTPVYQGYDPSQFNETAYLYIYASINLPGGLVAGSYSGNINVSISYD